MKLAWKNELFISDKVGSAARGACCVADKESSPCRAAIVSMSGACGGANQGTKKQNETEKEGALMVGK